MQPSTINKLLVEINLRKRTKIIQYLTQFTSFLDSGFKLKAVTWLVPSASFNAATFSGWQFLPSSISALNLVCSSSIMFLHWSLLIFINMPPMFTQHFWLKFSFRLRALRASRLEFSISHSLITWCFVATISSASLLMSWYILFWRTRSSFCLFLVAILLVIESRNIFVGKSWIVQIGVNSNTKVIKPRH